jgi:hypothetical protein
VKLQTRLRRPSAFQMRVLQAEVKGVVQCIRSLFYENAQVLAACLKS